MKKLIHNSILRTIFFGNYFYGICAVALSMEAILQQNAEFPESSFFLMAFCATVLFYSKAYQVTEKGASARNIRSAWYARNSRVIRLSQFILMALLTVLLLRFIFLFWSQLLHLSLYEIILLIFFPLTGLLYYGIRFRGKSYELRLIGWLKPFIIALSWAGLVSIYPVLYQKITAGSTYYLSLSGFFLFIKNLMYITLLCILFDIKDYAMDYNQQLKTFVVKLGLRKTMFWVIIPLALTGFGSFLLYALFRDFSFMKIMINSIPFASIIIATYAMSNRRSIFFYLMVIDGLMLLKAICGITGVLYF